MGPVFASSLLIASTTRNKSCNRLCSGVLVAGCVLLYGCGAPSINLFRSSSIEDAKASVADVGPDAQRAAGAGALTPPLAAISTGLAGSGGTAALIINAEADALKTSTNVAVNQNPLGRLRGRFAQLVPSSMTCSSSSITGAAQDNCTVNLDGVVPTSLVVSLASNNSFVSVPSSITVAKGASSATFPASITAVTSTSTATLAASANGGSATVQLQLNPATPTLASDRSSINFGNVTAGQTVTQSLILTNTGTAPVTISGISIVGSLFTMPGTTAPVTLNPGQTLPMTVQFYSPHVSTFTGVMTIASKSSQGSLVVNMNAAGVASLGVNSISCVASSMSGAGSDTCTVTLTAAAPTGGVLVTLASNRQAVSIPATVTVPANGSAATFAAAVASVTAAQTATLTATAGGTSATFAIQLSPAGQGKLSVNATTIAFGNVAINDTATQSLTLSSTGTSPVTINSAAVTGTGFSVSGTTFPLTLNAGQTATLNAQFSPTTTGASTGQLTMASNSSTGATTNVSLSGTGQPHQVQLSWIAPSGSTDPVSGYRIYRAAAGSSSYQLLNSALDKQANYHWTTQG